MYRIEEKHYKDKPIERAFARIFFTHPEPSLRIKLAEDYLFMKKYGKTFEARGEDVSAPCSVSRDKILIIK